jgi:hypothetical protein
MEGDAVRRGDGFGARPEVDDVLEHGRIPANIVAEYEAAH